ncbi:MAG: prenyltransferase [Aeriscardovia aeriphila]|nr:prenyltransferase [Aeriscardovia aeriphila]
MSSTEYTSASFSQWVQAGRPLTLLLGLSSSVTGVAVAWMATTDHSGNWYTVALLCILTTLLLQIGANYIDDYADGVRGLDSGRSFSPQVASSREASEVSQLAQAAGPAGSANLADTAHQQAEPAASQDLAQVFEPHERVLGPARLVASGVNPRSVLTAALVCFALACATGIAATVLTGRWKLLLIGAACLFAAWSYVCKPLRLGSHALGEVLVFAVFGIAAVCGTQYALVGFASAIGWFAAASMGFTAVAVLLINNTRDLRVDKAHGKVTLSVLTGHIGSVAIMRFALILAGIATLIPAVWTRGSSLFVNINLMLNSGSPAFVVNIVALVLAVCPFFLALLNPVSFERALSDYQRSFTLTCILDLALALDFILMAVAVTPIPIM